MKLETRNWTESAENGGGGVVILGSASERRRKILTDMGARFEVVVPQVEEVLHPDDPRRTVAENAVLKNRWCRQRYPGRMILTADTALDFRGRVINKPASLEQAAEFLRQLSGESHKVLTAVGASDLTGETDVFVVESRVTFKVLVEDAIREYFRRVDPLDKAGAYDIDQSPELIIASYCGSRTNIMGLPAEAVGEWLGEHGAGSMEQGAGSREQGARTQPLNFEVPTFP